LSVVTGLLAVKLTGCSSPSPATEPAATEPPAQNSFVAKTPEREPSPQAMKYLEDARVELAANNFNAARAMIELAAQEGAPDEETGAMMAELERELAKQALAEQNPREAYEHRKLAADAEPEPAKRFDDLIAAIELGRQTGVLPANLAPLASRAVEIKTSSAKAQQFAAQLWDDAGQPQRALPYYQWLHKVEPDDTTTSTRLGTILLGLKKIDAARRIFEKIYRAHPEHVIAGIKLAGIYATLAEFERADALYQKLVQANPDSAGLLIRYSRFLKSRGRNERAAQLEARARQALPGVERREMRELR
jgi:Tfp pilus assembly protein PilF